MTSVCGRRNAELFFEKFYKIRDRADPDLFTTFAERTVGSQQEIGCIFDSDGIQICRRRTAEFILKFFAKVYVAVSELLADDLQSFGIFDIFAHGGETERLKAFCIVHREL